MIWSIAYMLPIQEISVEYDDHTMSEGLCLGLQLSQKSPATSEARPFDGASTIRGTWVSTSLTWYDLENPSGVGRGGHWWSGGCCKYWG
ncbi:hypothetical protein CXB51_034281 [Gossypium anomalum]|uniref:Uncharacterized protein n=1 Tax=Gossypium anomalum TaxID=47600 RepID=A0A8J5Y5Y1_9ROSI|nr:hypothetical protein CXB51_034281 [Gossypium anomalum]